MKVRLPLSLLFACAASSVVAVVANAATPTFGFPVTPMSVFSDPLLGKQWQWNTNKNGVNIAPVWDKGILGTGVVIGIIDEWVEPNHEDLNVSPYNPGTNLDDGLSKDFVNREEIRPGEGQNYTGEDHGTFVAGMAAAIGGNDTGVVGAAPGATIAGLHVDLSLGQITQAALWASGITQTGAGITYSGEARIQVKNCSFGGVYGQETSKSFSEAVRATSKNNVIYVFAAGNSRGADGHNLVGSTGWSSEGNNSSIINVGATNSKGTYADFSSFGSNLFISAPGAEVVSTDRTGELGYNAGGISSSREESDTNSIANSNYASSDGTSFSSPLVAGVIALGKEICPVMDVRWAKHALAYSSGHNNAPNIDAVYDSEKKTWVQKSGYSKSESNDDGEQTTERIIPTGDWVKNSGGYWFNNNYGFGLVDPEGFIKQVRDIAYTTVETAHVVSNAKITKTTGSETSGDIRNAEFAVDISKANTAGTLVSGLGQQVETVSVSVSFSEDATQNVNFNVNSLKLILTDSTGIESVLVQQSSGDPVNSIGGDAFSYTFLSNAFWGSSYSGNNGWKIRVEYGGVTADGAPVDMTDWITIDSVNFTMGAMVKEGDLSFYNRTENAHALVLDSKSFTVGSGGEFFVEDAFYINDGVFTVHAGGTVGAYKDAELKKGAIFVQTGGVASIYGNAVFDRGLHLYGGNFTLGNSITSGGDGTVINGGTFTVVANADSIAISAGNVKVNGGHLVLNSNANFGSSVTIAGGQLSAGDNSKGTGITITGGLAVLGNKTEFTTISAGASATESEEAKGGGVIISGKTTLTGGLQLQGVAVAEIRKNAVVTNTSAVSVANSAYLSLIENTKITGSLSVAGGTAAWTGKTEIGQVTVSGGVLAAHGTTTIKTTELSVEQGGSFKVGKTTVDGIVEVRGGATLLFASRSRNDYDFLTVKNGNAISFETPTPGTTTTLKYDFGDAVPHAATLIKLSESGAKFTDETMAALDFVTITPSEGTPQILDDSKNAGVFVPKDMTFGIEEVAGSLILSLGEEFDNLHLYYASQSSLYSAVQATLLRNDELAKDFLEEFNLLEHASALFSTVNKLAVPMNVVAIDELHDKQANALTGAISRRSRELRSGFIHSDTWSNPLFGSSGFSFSARPNLVAAKGFVPYSLAEDDYPLMVWLNGGYSFSAVDDGAMSVSSTKSNMLNLVMGADYGVSENFSIGIFAGYTNGRTKFDDGGRTEIQSRNIGVYLTGSKTSSIGSLYYTALAAYGYEEYDFSRKVSVGDINSSASASPSGWQGIAFLEGGYEWKLKKFSMGPSLSLRYVLNNIDGYTESSPESWNRQEVDDVRYDSLQSSIGWRFAYRADFETVSLLPEVRISWNHEFIGTDEDFDARLAMPNSDPYTNTINSTGDDYATVGAGLTVMLGEVSTLTLDYDMQFLRDDADPVHTINAIFRTRF